MTVFGKRPGESLETSRSVVGETTMSLELAKVGG